MVSPNFKKTFVKLDHLLKNRVENSQNIWVATTKFWKLWGFKGENGLKLVTNKTTSIVGEQKTKTVPLFFKISYVEKMGGFSINTRGRNPDQWSVQKDIFIDLDSKGTPPTSTRVTRQLFLFHLKRCFSTPIIYLSGVLIPRSIWVYPRMVSLIIWMMFIGKTIRVSVPPKKKPHQKFEVCVFTFSG